MKTLEEGRRVLRSIGMVAAVAVVLLGVIGYRGGTVAQAQPAESVALNQKKIDDIVGSAKNRGLDVTVIQEKNANVFLIKSVDQWLLKQLIYQHVRVTGIVSTFDQTKQRYRFQTPDNSTVFVAGKYPGHGVTRTLDATVGDKSPFMLYEIEIPPPPAPKWPYIAAGVLLIALALGFIYYSNQQKIAREKAESAAAAAAAEAADARSKVAEAEARADAAARAAAAAAENKKTIHSIGSLKAETGPFAGISFPLTVGEIRIGRKKSSDVQIALEQDNEVSSYHGSLFVLHDGRATYKDASSNGSIVNGQFVQHGQVDVPDGGKIEIGGTTFTLAMRKLGNAPAVSSGAPAAEASSGPRDTPTVQIKAPAATPAPASAAAPTAVTFGAELEVQEGPEKGQRIPVSKPVLTFGREARDILLSDPSISRSHATLTLKDGQYTLTDDGSTHGTSVNGEKIDGTGRRLSNGDEIVFGSGNTRLKFRSING